MTDTALEPVRVVEVLDRVQGELVNIRTANEARLAALVESLRDLQTMLGDEIALIGSEILGRLDKEGSYTLHVGDSTHRWKISAPSKDAKTSRVDATLLRAQLMPLVEYEPVISDALARAALRRRVSIDATVNVTTDLLELVATLEQMTAIGKVPVFDVKVSTSEDVLAAGCAKLKRAGHGVVVAAATVEGTPPARKVKIERETA